MPEYLAPGVYVEETSFRAKSIEGVGTSTTAFVGPTRKGPIVTTQPDAAGNPPIAPELLTSFGDFERMYGGLEDLTLGATSDLNYLAHSVLQFFNEGGARLYVARVANQATPAATADLGPAGNTVFIRSRFSGAGTNGRATIAEIAKLLLPAQLNSAPDGSLLRVSDPTAAPASFEGGPLPVDLSTLTPGNIVLNLTVNGTPQQLLFAGQPAVLDASSDLVSNPATLVAIPPPGVEFRVRVDGRLRVVTVPAGSTSPGAFAAILQTALPDLTVTTVTQSNLNPRLRFTTRRSGTSASIEVLSTQFGFQAGASATSPPSATNNVENLEAVSFADLQARVAAINAALPAGSSPVLEAAELGGGRFALRTRLASSAAGLDIRGPGANEVSAQSALGLPIPPIARTGTGVAPAFFQRGTVASQQIWHVPGTPGTVMPAIPAGREVHLLSFSVVFDGVDHDSTVYDELAFGRAHPRFPGVFLAEHPVARADALFQPIWFDIAAGNPLELYNALFPAARTRLEEGRLIAIHQLTGGSDGQPPIVGTPTDHGSYAAAFELLRSLEDISIVAAPGHSAYPGNAAVSVRDALLAHVGRPRAYRIAVLDSRPRQMPGDVRDYRASIDSNRAALYYPWVTVPNPLARPGRDDVDTEINLPPSGFICGIYARNDVEQSVSKAPGNEVVRGALRFESDINFAQQQLLNPLGINCLRFFPGRGYRVWGARTASSDAEFKYVNVRRFFLYLESSIDRGTQWVVFENNGPRLWANVRETVEAFLYNEWVSGNLLGATPKEAFFVRCDRSTMTQNDLDNGRLICLIGVAALKPAEFVIFRIGQKTADERS
jgi:phage tail sheath protein FI